MFKFGLNNGLIDWAVRYGTEFHKPDKSVLRRHRARCGPKMPEAEELRQAIDGALVAGGNGPELIRPDPTLQAMILLGLNARLGNNDCATLLMHNVNPETGWLDFPRPETGFPRMCPPGRRWWTPSRKRWPCCPSPRATPSVGRSPRRTSKHVAGDA